MSTISFDDKDQPALKKWLVTRLEDISDADSDVLADYVLALVKSEEPDDQTRANCIENLEDFLRDHTQKFVDDVFATIRSKSYLPGHSQPAISSGNASFQPPGGPSRGSKGPQTGSSASPSFNAPVGPFAPPTGPSHSANARGQHLNGNANGRGDQSRKRSWNEHNGPEQHAAGNLGERAIKQMRRGGPNARGGRGGGVPRGPQVQNPPPMPTPPPGFPPLDPNNPMAAIMAMQAMGMPPMPDFTQFQSQSPSQTQVSSRQLPQKINQRCRDYDTKGFCAAGSECPYEHGEDHIVVGQVSNEPEDPSRQYSPNNPQHQDTSSNPRFQGRGNRGGRGGRGGMRGNRGGRAPFSSAGPNNDTRITSIVVEQIPEEKFSDEEVRNFFQEFGEIEDVNMQPYKRLAVVKFADYASAKKAYESPKVVFDNRFVKVYWHKPESAQNGHQPSGGRRGASVEEKQDDEEMIDPEEFAKRQAEAQRAHEEKAKKLKEAETAKEELDKRIKEQAEERRKLMEKLASKTEPSAKSTPVPAGSPSAAGGAAKSPTPGAGSGGTPAAQTAKEKATEALRAKLAELEAEAENLGIAPEDPNASQYPYHTPPYARGRGGYRGGYRGYDPSFRGGGRGGWRGARGGAAGGAVARLDNRPKNVSVTALDDGVDLAEDAVGEALRAHLYTIGSFASIQQPVPEAEDGAAKKSTKLVTFHERYVAELFIASTKHTGGTIPGIGKVDLQWVANAAVPQPVTDAASPSSANASVSAAGAAFPPTSAAAAMPSAASTVAKAPGGITDEGAGTVSSPSADVAMGGSAGGADAVDYDVADEDDEGRWMVS